MRQPTFKPDAFRDYTAWAKEDKKVYEKLFGLIMECCRTPFDGTGKPEPLKGNLKGYWSRRITEEHRWVYRATDDEITIVSCRGHYSVVSFSCVCHSEPEAKNPSLARGFFTSLSFVQNDKHTLVALPIIRKRVATHFSPA